MNIEMWYATAAIIAGVGQTLFVLLYVSFPWYETFLGRALFIKAMTLMFLLDAAMAGSIWDWEHEPVWIVTLLGFAAFGIWAQLMAFAIQRFTTADQDSTQVKRDYNHGTKTQGEHDGPLQGSDPRTRAAD